MHKYIRTMTVLAMSAISIFYLSGFFFFFLPLGWLLPNDKKTVEELEQKKDWAGLLGLSEIRIKNSPDESGWYYIRGLALQRMDKCTEAIPAYDLAIEKKNGDYDDAITNKALCQAEIREVDSAIQTLTMAIGRHPENWRHYYNMSYFYVKKEDSDKARIYLEQLRTRNLVVAKQLEENQIQPMERRLINEKKAAEAAAKYRQDREKLEREKTEREQQVREAEAFKMKMDAEVLSVRQKSEADAAESAATKTAEALIIASRRPAEKSATVEVAKSVEEQLKSIKQLYQKGLISKDAYESRQKEILKAM